jgi:hypothetical protein
VGRDGSCWAHLSSDELSEALNLLASEPVLDIRGTVVNARLFYQILGALYDPQSGSARIRVMRAQAAEFSEDASFDGVWFEGDAWFECAKFSGETSFTGAEFKRIAHFSRGEFIGETTFAEAIFGGDSYFDLAKFSIVDFRDAKFNSSSSFTAMKVRESQFDRSEFARDASFDRVNFGDSAWFAGAKFNGTANFSYSKFDGVASFQEAKFTETASFNSVRLGGFAFFNDTTFGDAVDFSEMEFSRGVYLKSMSVAKSALFDNAVFEEAAMFSDIKINGSISFADARFRNDLRLARLTAGEDVILDGCRIAADFLAEGLVVGGRLVLDRMYLAGQMRMVTEVAMVQCSGGFFGGRVSWSFWGGDLWLTDSAFAGPVTVESSLEPVSPEARSRPPWEYPQVVLRSLRGTDAEQLALIDIDLGRCLLLGLRRPELLRFGGRCTFGVMPSGWCWRWRVVPWRWTAREALFEEHVWRSHEEAPARAPGWNLADQDESDGSPAAVAGPARLAVLYRQLRLAVENGGNEPGAADLYFGEMEMRRLGAERRGERWLLSAYWLVSGYGLRAGRALTVLAVMVLAAAIALQDRGFPGHPSALPDYILFAAGSVVSLDLQGHLPGVLTDWGEAIRLVVRVAGPVLLGLAALAVRGRVKR